MADLSTEFHLSTSIHLENQLHLVKWATVSSAKQYGVLFIQNFLILNKAWLGKWLCRWCSEVGRGNSLRFLESYSKRVGRFFSFLTYIPVDKRPKFWCDI